MSTAQPSSKPNDHCRSALIDAKVCDTTHAGLWLDKFFTALSEEHPKDEERKWELAELAAALPAPELYARWYQRWAAALDDSYMLAQAKDYTTARQAFAVQGRMVVGLGADAPLENTITLHRTYGVPYIPGSALKGLLASYVYNYLPRADWWANPTDEPCRKTNISAFYTTLFGTTDEAGFITFFDAPYVPGSAQDDRPLCVDVLTVHHQAYYQGSAAPADWDSPIPVPFLSAVGSYLVALAGPKLWVGLALKLLTTALATLGAGAKTSSGYGRLLPQQPPSFPRRAFAQPARRQEKARAQSAAQPDLAAKQPQPAGMQPQQRAVQPATGAVTNMQAGTIQRFLADRGFGFIRPDGGEKQLFFHVKQFKAGGEPREGQRVMYRVRPGRKAGELEAYDIRLEIG